jgi:Tol biopolymer transport system component
MLLFSSAPPLEPADLYVAVRDSLNEPFFASAPLDDLNTAAEERDPWLSPDGSKLFFVSDRAGPLNIYQASAIR